MPLNYNAIQTKKESVGTYGGALVAIYLFSCIFSAVIVFVVVSTKEYVNKFPVCNHLVSGMTSGVGETSLSQGEREKEEVIERA